MTKEVKKDKKSTSLWAGFSRQPVEIKAGVLTLLAGLLSLTIPNFILEKLVVVLGISSIFPAAAPPIGYSGRAAIALMTALLAGIVAYFYFTSGKSKKSRRRFESGAQNQDTDSQNTPNFVDRLRRGYQDTVAPKATEWDAGPADAAFKPIDVERDLGAKFDESPYLQDPNQAYQNPVNQNPANSLDDIGVTQEPAVIPYPAPPVASPVVAPPPLDSANLEIDPASTLSDPQWRVRPAEALRENMLDLAAAQEIGVAPEAPVAAPVSAAISPPLHPPIKAVADDNPAEIDYIAMRKNQRQEGSSPEDRASWLRLGLDNGAESGRPAPQPLAQDRPVAMEAGEGVIPGAYQPDSSSVSGMDPVSAMPPVADAAHDVPVPSPTIDPFSIHPTAEQADAPAALATSAPVFPEPEQADAPAAFATSAPVFPEPATSPEPVVFPELANNPEPASSPEPTDIRSTAVPSAPLQDALPVTPQNTAPVDAEPAEVSVQELLARLEGALVERASRRAQVRLETQPAGIAPGLERTQQDMTGALKDALAALQNAAQQP